MQFMGYRREDGRVGVRNYVLILPGCACASETCRLVASEVRGTKNVIMNVGCSDVQANTDMNLRVLTGFALNPNVFGVIVIGLGCETVGHRELAAKIRAETSKPVVSFGIQEIGGTVATTAAAVKAAREMVAQASEQQREPCDASDLFVAIECGGSDATSGIASNPAVGNMSDRIVDLGGTTMMSETSSWERNIFSRNEVQHRKSMTRSSASARITKNILPGLDRTAVRGSRPRGTKQAVYPRLRKSLLAASIKEAQGLL